MSTTTAAEPPRTRRNIAGIDADAIAIGSGQPLPCLHGGGDPTTPAGSYLRLCLFNREELPAHPKNLQIA